MAEPGQQVVEDPMAGPELVEFTEGTWIHLRPDSEIGPVDLVNTYPDVFGLGAKAEFDIVAVAEDGDWEGVRVQQLHAGIPVEGAQFVIHAEGGRAREITGDGVVGFEQIATPDQDSLVDRAVDIAIAEVPASLYSWDLAHQAADTIELEQLYARPSAVLIWTPSTRTHRADASDYVLAYRVEVNTVEPEIDTIIVYVDAHTGEVLSSESSMKHACKTGSVTTLYDGPRFFTTKNAYELLWAHYRLTDECRGDEIRTRCDQDTSCEYKDTDNNWGGPAATAHWAAQRAWEYFHIRHSHTGVDDAGQRLYVFPDVVFGQPNASWSSNGRIRVGASGFDWGNLATLDVIGHEFAHGVVQHTAGLANFGEAAALNESFADIFGAMIEMENAGVSSDNWLLGEDAQTLRSMSAPWEFSDPSVYGGPHWSYSGSAHNDATVQDHWFFLLSQGGSQLDVTVNGIGASQAARIAYRSLLSLSPHATYADARTASILAASSLYGYCSNQVKETTNAWAAVGVGSEFTLCMWGYPNPCYGEDEVYSVITSAPSSDITWTIPDSWDYTVSPDKKSVTLHHVQFSGNIRVSVLIDGSEHQRVLNISVDHDCDGGGCLVEPCLQ